MENETRVWNMSILSVAMNHLENSNESIHFFAAEDSVISDCEIIHSPVLYTVVNGPALIIGSGEERTQHWIGAIDIVDNEVVIENPGSIDVSLNIEFDGNGPQWNVSNDIILAAGEVESVSATPPETGISFAWLELNDGEVILHLVNHEV